MKVLTILAIGAATAAVPAGATNLVINGGFEQPGGIVRDTLTPSYVPGWTYNSNGTGLDIYEDDTEDGLAAADGNHYLSFGHSGTYGGSITQDVPTVAGHTYRLSLAVAEQQGDDPTQGFLVELTTSLSGYSSFTLFNLSSTFNTVTLDFNPNGTFTTVKITDQTPAGAGFNSNLALDAISVVDLTPGTVPEPATWTLLLGGFGLAGTALRRRRGLAA